MRGREESRIVSGNPETGALMSDTVAHVPTHIWISYVVHEISQNTLTFCNKIR